jgi:hypothetical protein
MSGFEAESYMHELEYEIKCLRAVNKELLEALKTIKERTAQYGPFKSHFDMIALIAAKAIAKAEGKEEPPPRRIALP